MFKVGDKVRAISDNYGFTTVSNNWEGEVSWVDEEGGRFNAITTRCETAGYNRVGKEYHHLKQEKFELIEPEGLEGAVKII